VLEKDTVATIARLLWRKQNLGTLRIAELARARYSTIEYEEELESGADIRIIGEAPLEVRQAAETQASKELGETYELVDVGNVATVDKLREDLSVHKRLDAMIDKCLKRLLFLRDLKSLAPAPVDCRILSARPKTSFDLSSIQCRSDEVAAPSRHSSNALRSWKSLVGHSQNWDGQKFRRL